MERRNPLQQLNKRELAKKSEIEWQDAVSAKLTA